MSDSINRLTLLGGLTKDVEVKGEGDGRHAIMNIVTSDGYTDESGKWVETKDYHTVRTFLPHKITYLEKHGKKGAGIMCECKHSTRRVGEGESAKFYENFTVGREHTLTITRYAKDQDAD